MPATTTDLKTTLMVGMEVHVELSTRSKMWTSAPNVAHRDFHDAEPNTLTDPVVLGLPGTLPVINKKAVEFTIMAGLALGCEIPGLTKFDRKNYPYPDLMKGYQISQYDQPLCLGGGVDIEVAFYAMELPFALRKHFGLAPISAGPRGPFIAPQATASSEGPPGLRKDSRRWLSPMVAALSINWSAKAKRGAGAAWP